MSTTPSPPSLDELWESTPPSTEIFDPDRLDHLPEAARRYLAHAVAPGTELASAVRLRMHGQIRLGTWRTFEAEQVLRWDRGMIWRATVRVWGVPIWGFDALVDGRGAMQWSVLGLIPVASGSGSDITRSNVGRMAAELIWLPSALCRDEVQWTAADAAHAQARFTKWGETPEPILTLGGNGRPEQVRLQRWGDPDDGPFRYEPFGGIMDEEATFEGYTIPTRIRVGWHLGEKGFDAEGEFFRGVVEEATFR